MSETPVPPADPVRLWRHPDDFDMAMAQGDAARKESAKWKKLALRHCNRADRAEDEVQRLRGLLNDGSQEAR